MGNGNSVNEKLRQSIKKNKNDEVSLILKENPDILNNHINKENTMTPLMLAAFYNSIESANEILKLKPQVKEVHGDLDAYIISCEKDNVFILKSIYEYIPLNIEILNKEIEKLSDLNEEEKFNIEKTIKMNALDYAIINISYRCAYYLCVENGLKHKSLEYYLHISRILNKTSNNYSLFLECLDKKVLSSETPSFYLSKKQKLDLENHLPDPNESYSSFFKRMLAFRLYQPPLVPKESVSKDQKKSWYMKIQTKLLEKEFNKKSKFLFHHSVIK